MTAQSGTIPPSGRRSGLGLSLLLACCAASAKPVDAAPDHPGKGCHARGPTVDDAAKLMAALKAAKDGETIRLAPGEYALPKVQSLKFEKAVTVTSADAAHPAVLDGVYMQDVDGLTLSNLEVKVDPKRTMAIIVQASKHVTLHNLDIHGSGVGDGLGVMVKGADGVAVSNLDIHEVHGGIVVANSDNVTLASNAIHQLQDDSIQVVATSHITISDNYFSEVFPKPGDHADAIQFFTAGTKESAHDIVIKDNTYIRGSAPPAVQGVFMGNEAKIPYLNVTITGNTIIGGIYQGIRLTIADNVTVKNNVVQAYRDMDSWINIANSTHAEVSDNTSTSFLLDTANPGLVQNHNKKIGAAKIGDLSLAPPNPRPPNVGVNAAGATECEGS